MLPASLTGRQRLPKLWGPSSMDRFRMEPRGARWWSEGPLHPGLCWGTPTPRAGVWHREGSIHKPPTHSFKSHLLGKWDRHKGRLRMRQASRPQQLTAKQSSKTRTGQCGEGAARDTPGCGGRGREGVKANWRRGELLGDWAGGAAKWKSQGMGGGRSQWLQMSVILTLFTHKHEEQRAKSKGVTSSLSW